MKRYRCTVSDRRGAFGEGMELSEKGDWVRHADISAPSYLELKKQCDRLVKFVEAIADTCEELSKDPTANLRGGALGIAHSARKNLPRILSGEPK